MIRIYMYLVHRKRPQIVGRNLYPLSLFFRTSKLPWILNQLVISFNVLGLIVIYNEQNALEVMRNNV